ncbi:MULTISPECIES: hypothetical protein [Pseudomonas]|uniref:hypothetical protein n=1 Tax=Pseudomonas TaxID=286 RepID=UPI0013CE6722|nr:MULTISPECIES: hypothetical protein [Pseudomonas]MBD8615535.1 hypothetical protein [Pseudomonas putida]MBD8681813.1 hypothetical protein [Pseudomonas sp. CFBP 13719]
MTNGLTVDEAMEIVKDFYREYPALQQISCEVFPSEKEAFGDEYAQQSRETKTRTSGAYLARDRAIFIPAASNYSEEDLRATLRHELIGHFGLNTFTTDQKRNILNAILRFKGSGKEPENWAKIQGLYPRESRDTLAEEYFAHICEAPAHPDVKLSERSLEQILTSKSYIPSNLEISGLANYVEKLASENVLKQQHMPSSNGSSFKIFMNLEKISVVAKLATGRFIGPGMEMKRHDNPEP